MKILVANIGSTSFKYRLYEMETETVLSEGRVERIGQQGGQFLHYEDAIDASLKEMVGPGKPLQSLSELSGVGFKTIGAKDMSGCHRVDERLLNAMESYNFLFPAHNPPYIAAMRAFQQVAPKVPLVALFETAFFDSMADCVSAYALPYKWRTEQHIKKLGFHGASHHYASLRAKALCDKKDLRHISCHLGGSSSMAAVKDGVAVDTSFGMTPQSGLPQNNRVGDVDVFAILYLMKELGLTIEQTTLILSKESGLAGLSGKGGDMRDIKKAAGAGDSQAQLAIDAFTYGVRRYLGSFFVCLNGVDIITFSGGIGEKDPLVRKNVLSNLEWAGVKLDPSRNEQALGDQETRISSEDSQVAVWVIKTNEEIVVARAAAQVIGNKN